MDKADCGAAHSNRSLPDCCFLEAGIVSLSLPPDFDWVGPAACARCQQLQTVDLSQTSIYPWLDLCSLLAIATTQALMEFENY